MINSYTNTVQTIDVNEPLLFSVNRVLTGCTVTHVVGTGEFKLNKPGYYYVNFNGVAATTAAGSATVNLMSDGVAVPGATASVYTATPTEAGSLSFSSIIKVMPTCFCSGSFSPTTLTIQNDGLEAAFSNVNITITKLC